MSVVRFRQQKNITIKVSINTVATLSGYFTSTSDILVENSYIVCEDDKTYSQFAEKINE